MKEMIKDCDDEQVIKFTKTVKEMHLYRTCFHKEFDNDSIVMNKLIDKEIKNKDIYLLTLAYLEDLVVESINKSFIAHVGKHYNANLFVGFVEGFTETMIETYRKKNHDYGNSFDKSLDEDGLLVAKIRIGDKINRYNTLKESEAKVNDESIYDTLLDLANYCIMTIMWIDLNYKKNK